MYQVCLWLTFLNISSLFLSAPLTYLFLSVLRCVCGGGGAGSSSPEGSDPSCPSLFKPMEPPHRAETEPGVLGGRWEKVSEPQAPPFEPPPGVGEALGTRSAWWGRCRPAGPGLRLPPSLPGWPLSARLLLRRPASPVGSLCATPANPAAAAEHGAAWPQWPPHHQTFPGAGAGESQRSAGRGRNGAAGAGRGRALSGLRSEHPVERQRPPEPVGVGWARLRP